LLDFIWTEFFYRPLYNVVIFTYNLTPGPNLGWAIISLAIFIRLLFLYFSVKGYRTDAILESLAPQTRAIESDKYLSSREKRAKITELLKSKSINPYAEIWALAAQIIFLIGLYQVIQNGFNGGQDDLLYSFVKHPEAFNTVFYGIDLVKPSVLLSATAAGILFLELVLEYNAKKDVPRSTVSERWFPVFIPLGTFMLLVILPATKALFVITSVIFSLVLRSVIGMALSGQKSRKHV
jgi:membrane protein insertase Oxa1/YidC/SpoIIIJ